MKVGPIFYMDDLERLQIAAQRTRQRLLEVLHNDGDLNNTNQLSKKLKSNYRLIVFHLRILEKAGLVGSEIRVAEPVYVKTRCYFITKKGRELFPRISGI
jgi:predicted ArsR family transcriptional regulator